MKLMKLETLKNDLKPYKIASIFILIFSLIFPLIIIFGETITSDYVGQNISELINTSTSKVTSYFQQFYLICSLIFVVSFSILAAVMHSKITVDEYLGKKSALLFSYPYSRSKILYAKCGLVSLFTSVAYLISSLVMVVAIAILSNIFNLLPFKFTLSSILSALFITFICLLFTNLIGLIAMRVGFWKKSIFAPIIASLILCSPFSNLIQIIGGNTIFVILAFIIIMSICVVILMNKLSMKVDVMEVN